MNLFWAFELLCVLVLLALHPRRWLVLRRLLLQIAIMYFLRGLTIAVTLLPRIEATCENKPVRAPTHCPLTEAYTRLRLGLAFPEGSCQVLWLL